MKSKTPIIFAALCVAILLASGCGPSYPLGKVSGTVTYNGEPVKTGDVTFHPAEGRVSVTKIENGQIIDATTFETGDGATLGATTVTIAAFEVTGTVEVQSEEDPEKTYQQEVRESLVPLKYDSVETSGLNFTIEKGKNELKIEPTD